MVIRGRLSLVEPDALAPLSLPPSLSHSLSLLIIGFWLQVSGSKCEKNKIQLQMSADFHRRNIGRHAGLRLIFRRHDPKIDTTIQGRCVVSTDARN